MSVSLLRRRVRTVLAAVLAVAATAALPAVAHADMQPGNRPADVNPATRPPLDGSPGPDKRAWASADNNCSGGPQAGTENLLRYLQYWWPRGENWGIYNCRPPSLHSDGRAVDFHLDVSNSGDKAAGYEISAFLRDRDRAENKWAMARRWGIQEIIYDCMIWTAARANDGWRRYSVCDQSGATYTDKHKDHIHIGQNWKGANRNTTAWTGYSHCFQCASNFVTDVSDDPFSPDPALP